MKYFVKDRKTGRIIEAKPVRQRAGGDVHISDPTSIEEFICWPLCDVDAEHYDYVYVDLPITCKSCLAILPKCQDIKGE